MYCPCHRILPSLIQNPFLNPCIFLVTGYLKVKQDPIQDFFKFLLRLFYWLTRGDFLKILPLPLPPWTSLFSMDQMLMSCQVSIVDNWRLDLTFQNFSLSLQAATIDRKKIHTTGNRFHKRFIDRPCTFTVTDFLHSILHFAHWNWYIGFITVKSNNEKCFILITKTCIFYVVFQTSDLISSVSFFFSSIASTQVSALHIV